MDPKDFDVRKELMKNKSENKIKTFEESKLIFFNV
jgi:hypothetical protein